MVFSISPSVTIREVDATAVIPAVSDSPAAIAGVFTWGPENQRVLISSEKELSLVFGEPDLYTDTSGNTAIQWSNQETYFTAADYLSYSNAIYVTRVTNNAVTAQDSDNTQDYFTAKYKGKLGNSIGVSIVTGSDAYENVIIPENSGLTGSISFGSEDFTIETDTDIVNDGSNQVQTGDLIRIGNDTNGYQTLTIGSVVEGATDANTGLTEYTVSFADNQKYRIPEETINSLSFTRLSKAYNVTDGPPETDNFHIIVTDEDGSISGNSGTVLEIYENLSTVVTSKLPDGTSNFYKTVIEGQSDWVKVGGVDVDLTSTPNNNVYLRMTGGSDGDDESVVSLGSLAQGYDLYKESDEVDISFLLVGKSNNANLANYLVSNIAEYRKDCVVFVSPRKEDVVDSAMISNSGSAFTKVTNVINFRDGIQNSSYWFMDSGYKYRYDKYNDTYVWVPLNGDMAGLSARIEPWESPAGYKRGLIRNVVKLAFNPNKSQRDQLYSKDVNPVITQTGQGTLLFGDKTGLGRASAFNRINVRRLFITVEKAIATVAASFLFDFNDEFTQTQFKNLVEPFLRDIQGKRGIIDFRVVSDETINTPDVIDSNVFRGNIFIKPARTINNIELTFIATRTGIEFEEIVGQQF